MEHPLVCIMPLGHELAAKSSIEPQDLDGVAFVTFNPDSNAGQCVSTVFERYRVKPHVVLVANISPTLCELVAAGLGVSLVHPLMVSGLEQRLVIRRFEPDVLFGFRLCSSRDNRNAQLARAFAEQVRITAEQVSTTMLQQA